MSCTPHDIALLLIMCVLASAVGAYLRGLVGAMLAERRREPSHVKGDQHER